MVQEWLSNSEQYQHLVQAGLDYYSEAKRFLMPGHFAASVGDAMPLAAANVLQLPLVLVMSVTDWPLTIITPQVQAISNVPLYFTFTQEESGHHDSLIELSRPQHGGHRVTQNRSSSPFILFSCYPWHWCLILPNFKMAANFSVEEVVEIVAREEEMDVHVQEEVSEEVTLTERITVPKGVWRCQHRRRFFCRRWRE